MKEKTNLAHPTNTINRNHMPVNNLHTLANINIHEQPSNMNLELGGRMQR